MGPPVSWTRGRSMEPKRELELPEGKSIQCERPRAVGCGVDILAPGRREENLQTHCGLLKH